MITTTTNQKKLVYRQDPDGVFRLKCGAEDASIVSPKKKKKKRPEVHNELLDLSYKISGDDITTNAVPDPSTTPAFSPEPLMVHAPQSLHSVPDSERGSLPDPAPSESHVITTQNLKRDKRKHIRQDNEKDDECSIGSPSSRESHTTHSHYQESVRSHISDVDQPTPYSQLRSSLVTMVATKEAQIFHIPSFALGLGTAFVLYRFRDPLLIMVVGLVGIVAALVVFSVVAGTAFFYLGLLKIEDLTELRVWKNQFMARIRGNPSKLPQEMPSHPEDSGSSDLEIELEYEKTAQTKAAMEDAIDSARAARAALETRSLKSNKSHKSADDVEPPVLAPRNTYTTVKPFKHSYTDELMTRNRKAPQLNRSQSHDVKRDIMNKVEMFRAKNEARAQYKVSNPELVLHKSDMAPYKVINPELLQHRRRLDAKQLPPHPSEAQDLPLINEVKLMSGKEFDPYENRRHPNLVRLNTVASKQSVLGTRQGYNMFMANAEGDD